MVHVCPSLPSPSSSVQAGLTKRVRTHPLTFPACNHAGNAGGQAIEAGRSVRRVGRRAAARSTQHTARSTQHTARSTQHMSSRQPIATMTIRQKKQSDIYLSCLTNMYITSIQSAIGGVVALVCCMHFQLRSVSSMCCILSI